MEVKYFSPKFSSFQIHDINEHNEKVNVYIDDEVPR